MRKEYIIAIAIIFYIVGSILVYFSPDATSHIRKVSLSGQKLQMNQDTSQFANQSTGFRSQNVKSKNSVTSNKKIALNNSNTDFNNSFNGMDNSVSSVSNTEYKTKNVKMNNSFMQHVNIDVSDYSARKTNSRFDNTAINRNSLRNSSDRDYITSRSTGLTNNRTPYTHTDYEDNYLSNNNAYNNSQNSNNYSNDYTNNNSNYSNNSNSAYNNSYNNSTQNNGMGSRNTRPYNTNTNQNAENNDKDRYRYEDIDWRKWKSNFLNRILDDCDSVPGLNNYPMGTWLWISFDVSNTGDISNVVVFSKAVYAQDRQKLGNLIKSYAHSQITVFPQKSRRKSANVRFIMTIDTQEKRSKPEDFFDKERIFVKE